MFLNAEQLRTLRYRNFAACNLVCIPKSYKGYSRHGSSIFVHPILDIVKRIHEKTGINLIKGHNIDEVFENLFKIMPTTRLVKEYRFEKLAPNKYVLHVDHCVWAPHIHKELKPKDVTCPYELTAMAMFEKVLGGKVKVADSEYHQDGTTTKIELL